MRQNKQRRERERGKKIVTPNKKAGLCFVCELSVAQRLILFPLFLYYFCFFLLQGIIHLSSCIWWFQSFSLWYLPFSPSKWCANARNHSLSLCYHFLYRCVNKTTEPKTTIHSCENFSGKCNLWKFIFLYFYFMATFFLLCIFFIVSIFKFDEKKNIFIYIAEHQIANGRKKSEFVYFDNWKSKQLNNTVHLQANNAQHNAIIVSQFSN